MEITVDVVKRLIKEQYPNWGELEIRPVEQSGHDNRTFYLGDDKAIRLPSGIDYASQIEKEIKWLPKLKPYLTIDVPNNIAKGKPTDQYPFHWAINQWIYGETVNYKNVNDLNELAKDLAKFLKEIQSIDAKDGPKAGDHNFYRGGSLKIYDEETRDALEVLKDIFPTRKLQKIWNTALESKWQKEAVWVHGDVAVGNLLVSGGELCAVIDFGILGTGDPACDYVMAWTFFNKESRSIFKERVNCDLDTWNRAKGWALWKALITYDIYNKSSEKSLWARRTIKEILSES